ncbi:MAG: SMC family ATPase [Anaerolineaceae bacterium]|nr:SMC family ATPase [Anaerolineaceae bacterium]
MIPVSLTLKGFLSYREQVSLDFSGFEMACVIGPNGSGKSSLLDAMTWALFGKARSVDDDLINMQGKSTEVAFTFDYEGQRYEVVRSKKRRSTKVMNLQIFDDASEKWVSLSEATMSETQEKLERILKMDYDTFINASFFLQGKADQFAKQRPADRKITLAKILELDIWETYQERTARARKDRQTRFEVVNQWLSSLYTELGQEEELQKRLATLEEKLKQQEEVAGVHEQVVQSLRRQREQAEHQREQVRLLQMSGNDAVKRLENHQRSLAQNREEKKKSEEILSNEQEVLNLVEAWKQTKTQLDSFEVIAKTFNEMTLKRVKPLQIIHEQEFQLVSKLERSREKQQEFLQDNENLKKTQKKLAETRLEQEALREEVSIYPSLEENRDHLMLLINQLEIDRTGLHREMQQLSDRIRKLESIDTVTCPVCGQTLEPEHRASLILELRGNGRELKDAWEKLGEDYKDYDVEIEQLTKEINRLRTLEIEKLVRVVNTGLASLEANEGKLLERIEDWERNESEGLKELERKVSENDYAHKARTELAEIDEHLKSLGYDSAAHDELRLEEQEGRESQNALQKIEGAKSAMVPLERVIVEQGLLLKDMEQDAKNASELICAAEEQQAALEADENAYRDASRKWMEMREAVNQTRQELGGAHQSIFSLEEKRNRKIELEQERESLASEIDRLKMLEEAFSQNGIPALLIEQAIPEIEEQANEILSRLSTTGMMVHFRTQRAYKDKKRKDKRETLDIIISDNAGERSYEMYSGGEAFRVNFAIRLALSKMLAGRAGARLQTLVIDEGFGSQDSEGIQRLIEAINLIKDDFAKILVITHLDSLKESFPAQIQVTKNLSGSSIEVLV